MQVHIFCKRNIKVYNFRIKSNEMIKKHAIECMYIWYPWRKRCLAYSALFMALLVALMHKLKEKLAHCKIHLVRRVQSRSLLTVH